MTLKQKAFVKALTDPTARTFCNATASYRKASPNVNANVAGVEGFRNLRKPKILEAIEGQLGLDELGDKLKLCLHETEKAKDWPELRAVVMDYAKLTGQLVEKREQTNISVDESSAVREFVRQSMTPAKG